MAKGKFARVKSESEESSLAASSVDDDGDDSNEEASEDMSDEESQKFVAFGLESDTEESLHERIKILERGLIVATIAELLPTLEKNNG